MSLPLNIPLGRILPVFFSAMENGYAGGASKGTIAEIPGSKTILHEDSDFRVLDCYVVTPDSSYSFGTTTIWYQGVPVWMMQYRGSYTKEMIPFLKRALMTAYAKQEFFGGRGPDMYTEGGNNDLFYVNRIAKNDWQDFKGREEIINRRNHRRYQMGWHEYDGLLLV